MPPGDPRDSNKDEINHKVMQAQEQLMELRRQQDEIERQKRELEDLHSKNKEFEEGRRSVLEKLERGLVILENQEFEVKREAEQLRQLRESFTEQLMQVREIDPSEWQGRDVQSVQSDLTRALARVDQAHAIHSQARSRLAKFDQGEDEGGEYMDVEAEKSFLVLIKEGFAFTLPLMIFATIAMAIWILLHKLGTPAT